jgi:hypothetical protein
MADVLNFKAKVLLNSNTPPQMSFREIVLVFKDEKENSVLSECFDTDVLDHLGARSALIFNGVGPNIQNCKISFRKELIGVNDAESKRQHFTDL